MYSIGQNRICQDAVVFCTARTVVFCTARSRINLFTRLLVAQDRNDISLRKALGFTLRDIKGLYFLRYLPVLLAGILAGILSGNLLGEQLAGIFLKTLGAMGFRFRIDGKAVCGWIPAVAVVTVSCGVLLGLLEVKHIRAYECCMGKE